jgi:hypothetical protein
LCDGTYKLVDWGEVATILLASYNLILWCQLHDSADIGAEIVNTILDPDDCAFEGRPVKSLSELLLHEENTLR